MTRLLILFVVLELTSLVKSEFYQQFLEYDPMNSSIWDKSLDELWSSEVVENQLGSNVINAQNAGCDPILTPVSLKSRDAENIYYPQCVLLERCGGCCFGSALSCQPTEVEKVKFKIMKLSLTKKPSSSRTRVRTPPKQNTIIIDEVRHKKCGCDCTLRKSQCNSRVQNYNSKTCTCDCKDKAKLDKCYKRNNAFWDPKECECFCIEVSKCSTGSSFSHDTCKCQ